MYNISPQIIAVIKSLYDKATSAVLHNSAMGNWFKTTIGVRQGCLLSPILFNIFLERIIADALADHECTVSIGGRAISNLRFADDIDGLAGEEQELDQLVQRLDTTSRTFGMEISAEKTKMMTNNPNGIQTDIKIQGQSISTVQSFKYLGAMVSDNGSRQEVLSRSAQTIAALTRLKPIWKDKTISLHSKVRLLRALVISIFLYSCETWTLTADLQRRIQSMEMRCYRRILGISYTQHIVNDEVRRSIT